MGRGGVAFRRRRRNGFRGSRNRRALFGVACDLIFLGVNPERGGGNTLRGA